MVAQKVRRHMRPNISRRSRQKYRHSPIPVGAGFHRLTIQQTPHRTRLQWSSFDQRIRPSPQRRNMDVDPVIPPVEKLSLVSKLLALALFERIRELLHIVRREVVLIQQDEGLEQFN